MSKFFTMHFTITGAENIVVIPRTSLYTGLLIRCSTVKTTASSNPKCSVFETIFSILMYYKAFVRRVRIGKYY